MNADEAIEAIHEANYLLLCEVDRICKKYEIEYFLSSGTLLGAVRENDFIQWDDDVDIILKRNEFEKLLIHRDEFRPPFEMVLPNEPKDTYFDMIPKLNYMRSKLNTDSDEIRYYEGKHNCISLDFFILDYTYSDIRGRIQRFTLKKLHGYAMSYRYKLDFEQYSLIQKFIVFSLVHLGQKYKIASIIEKYQSVAKRFNCNEDCAYYYISNAEMQFLDILYDRAIFSEAKQGILHHHSFPIPKGYDALLSKLYGNYMSPPPPTQRVPRHISNYTGLYIDFNQDCI